MCIGSFFVPISNAASSSSTTHLFTYTVQSGDSLYLIGNKYVVPWQSIASQNNIQSPYIISIGEQLEIPLSSPSVSYIVRAGDYLGLIGQRYEVSWVSIASANQISSPYIINVGEVLQIPLIDPSCSYQSSGGADGSGWWCWNVSTSVLSSHGLPPQLTGVASYFGACAGSLEQDNGYFSTVPVWNGETLAIPNGNGCPMVTQSWVWLWENYASGLNTIASHLGAITTVSPNTYTLSNSGTFIVQSTQAEICPQVHALGLKCVPLIQNDQSSPAGINILLTNSTLQATFIQKAVSTAVNSNLDGYNVDFEPSSGTLSVATEYGTFLTNFANAMHAHGKTLSVDVASWDGGALWNLAIEAHTTVNLILTMTTYNSNYASFAQGLQTIVSQVPIPKIAIGLLTVSDDSSLAQRMQAIEAADIHCVMVWPSYPGFLTDTWLNNLSSYETRY